MVMFWSCKVVRALDRFVSSLHRLRLGVRGVDDGGARDDGVCGMVGERRFSEGVAG